MIGIRLSEPSSAGTEQGAMAPVPRDGLALSWYQVGLIGVMLLGAFYRLYRIGVVPLEMGPDLAHNYNNIRLILQQDFLIFFPSHPGREGLFFYVAAPFCRVFGLNHANIKLVASLIGLVTLPVIYLLGKELFNREIGLYAAFFLGISHWHIILVRVGYRASLVPPLVALTWYFLVKGLKTGRRWFFMLSGLFLGLGMYTYNAFMVAPAMLVLMLLGELLAGRKSTLISNRGNVLLLFLTALYVFIPLGRYAYEEPAMYWYRAATRITSLERPLPGSVVTILFSNMVKTMLMFNVTGDSVFIANVPYLRQLGFVTAILFVLGLSYVLWTFRRGYNLTILGSLAVMLLPMTLALAFPHEVPNAIRAIGALPATVLLPAVALGLLRQRFAALIPDHQVREVQLGFRLRDAIRVSVATRWKWPIRQVLVAVLVVVLGIETWSVYPLYFQDYLQNQPALNYSISLEMARAIDAFADDGEAFIKVMPYWYDGDAVRAQLRRVGSDWNNELPALLPDQPPLAGSSGKIMVILHPADQEALQVLRGAFPRGISLHHVDNAGQLAFITFYGER